MLQLGNHVCGLALGEVLNRAGATPHFIDEVGLTLRRGQLPPRLMPLDKGERESMFGVAIGSVDGITKCGCREDLARRGVWRLGGA